MYVAGLSVWGLFYACYAGTYDSVIYDVVLEETGSADSYEHWFGRVQMYDSVAFITGALASALIAHFASLRAEFFLTIPVTCCAFLTLHRFREPSLHKAAERVRLGAHLGQLWKAMTTSPGVAWIAACLVCNLLAMRLLFESCSSGISAWHYRRRCSARASPLSTADPGWAASSPTGFEGRQLS